MAPFDWFYSVSYSISIWYINHFAKIRFRNGFDKLIFYSNGPTSLKKVKIVSIQIKIILFTWYTWHSHLHARYYSFYQLLIIYFGELFVIQKQPNSFVPSCHPDELVVRRWMGFDQFGLWTAIIGCYVPGLRLALWCFPEVNWLYSCTVIFTGVSGMILLRVQIKDKT